MLNSGRGWWSLVTGSCSWYARSSLMKFSIAPESNSDSTSALLDAVCMYALMIIDFLSDKYTRSSVPLLIQAAQIRAFKNLTLGFPLSGLRSYGVSVPCLQGTWLGLWPVILRPGRWPVVLPLVGFLDRPILGVLGIVVVLGSNHSWPLLAWAVCNPWRNVRSFHS